jgi:endonuclease I
MEIDGQPSIAEHETCDRYTADRSAKCPANKAREDKHALLTWTLQTERTDWTAGYTGVRSSVPIMHTSVKKSALLELARSRQMDTMDGYSRKYFQFKDFDCDCDHVVPWTISACNVDADLMLIAQDLRGLPEPIDRNSAASAACARSIS